MRGDFMTSGYLSRVIGRPSWLAHLLHPISLGPLLRGIGVRPIQGWHARPAEEWLREYLAIHGDLPAGEALSPAFMEELAAAREDPARVSRRPLSAALRWRYHTVHRQFVGPDILRGEARRQVERAALATIKGQLAELVAWLRRGGSLYTSPEGTLSPDGRLRPISSGFHRMVQGGPPELVVQPVAIIYDFMTALRPRVFVDLAPPIRQPATLPPRALDDLLRRSWLRAARFTATQLGAGFLAEAEHTHAPFRLRDLAADLHAQATTLHAAGRHVDRRLLTPEGAHRRATSLMEYLVTHKLIRRVKGGSWLVVADPRVIRMRWQEVGYHDAPLTYAWNELSELLSVEATLPISPHPPALRITTWAERRAPQRVGVPTSGGRAPGVRAP
jgi:hypothetical protein